MKRLLLTLFITCLFSFSHWLTAQCSIGDPSTDAPSWDNGLSIEENFNEARRWEEIDRGLQSNCLGNMSAPPGGWGSRTDDEIALWIHNSERAARNLLPLYGVETNLDNVAQAHSDWQLNTDVFSHGGNPAFGTNSSYTICPGNNVQGSSISQRINSNATLNGCWQLVAENLYAAGASNMNNTIFNDFVAKGIFELLYRDASVGWGHRHNIFKVYTNNHGGSDTEGFIGVGVSFGSDYEPVDFGCSGNWWGKILTIDYYDPFSACSGFSFNALPVSLIAFTGYAEKTYNRLEWSTASEVNSNRFEVERAGSNGQFVTIGSVNAAGESSVEQSYVFDDENPIAGVQYYRLKQVDHDGTAQYSPMVAIQRRETEGWQLTPNPFQDEIVLSSTDRNATGHTNLTIVDAFGKICYQTFIDGQEEPLRRIATSAWAAGLYFVQVGYEAHVLVKN